MELREFVSKALVELVSGVADAQKACNKLDAFIASPPVSYGPEPGRRPGSNLSHRAPVLVEFDMAVTVSQSTTGGAKGSASVQIASIGIGGQHERSSSDVSRLKFAVPVVLPDGSPKPKP